MDTYQSLRHPKWECQYHLVWIPKYRKKKLLKDLRKDVGELLREWARQKECDLIEGHLMPDHVHMLIAIPPKYSVAQVVGFLKGKRAIDIARTVEGRQRHFIGQHVWARG